ncbi:MAG TPA: sodium:proton antiporter NhaD [Flavobacteriales bacterium]|nr:sodium:proton antiporter NhaD [Flavobacteriales bacterium]
MFILMAVVFAVGYLAIALEHPIRINKAASAILTGAVVWAILMLGREAIFHGDAAHAGHEGLLHHLLEHLGDIGSILFFLMGAMTIVELVDVHEGFRVITDRITSTKKTQLLWIISIITFFLSAALDNLTTTIVMCALLRKLIKDKETLWIFAGMVIIAANAGGAWSPIGDVTTIMLWVKGQVTTVNIIVKLIVPSLVCLILPLLWIGRTLKGNVERPDSVIDHGHHGQHGGGVTQSERIMVLALGVGALLFVPVFKAVTHLPPFMGVMLGLGVLWIYTEIIHMRHGVDQRGHLMVTAVLRRIDLPSVLFFLGILVAVAGLQVAGHLTLLAQTLDKNLGDIFLINGAIGTLSAIVDNVPLVAAAQGMYPMTQYPPDHLFWVLLALCAGTGGSMLVIGSAAGVAAMGILHIDFIWYLKRMTIPAALGYIGSMITFWLMWH